MPANSTKTNARSKYFVFTINNPRDSDLRELRLLESECQYLVFGRETGQGGTKHLQGYIELRKRQRVGQLAKALRRAHLEVRRGTAEQADAYCKKDRDFYTFGQRSSDSQRGTSERCDGTGDHDEYARLVERIQHGAAIRDIVVDFPRLWLKHAQSIMTTIKMFAREEITPMYGPYRWSIDHSWDTSLMLVGPSGRGKTTWALTFFPNPLLISHIDELKAFDPGFHGGIVFDDMDFTHWPRTSQIHLLDTDFQRAIHVRYGTVILPKATKKIFTTNTTQMFLTHDPAIARRLTIFRCE